MDKLDAILTSNDTAIILNVGLRLLVLYLPAVIALCRGLRSWRKIIMLNSFIAVAQVTWGAATSELTFILGWAGVVLWFVLFVVSISRK